MATLLVLLDSQGRKHLVRADRPMVQVRGVGTFDAAKLEASVGRKVRVGTRSFLVLVPSTRDLHETSGRAAQRLTPKDIASLLYEADVHSGNRVIEAGTGSGAVTVAAARAVGPGGRVLAYDLREDFLAVARANVERAGLSERVEFRVGDVREPIAERDVDSFLLDIPDPWAAIPVAWDTLRPCGHLATFSPNMEQVKEAVAAIGKKPFVEVRTIELIEREMEVRDVGVRPSFAPLGHTGYLTFARKVFDTF